MIAPPWAGGSVAGPVGMSDSWKRRRARERRLMPRIVYFATRFVAEKAGVEGDAGLCGTHCPALKP